MPMSRVLHALLLHAAVLATLSHACDQEVDKCDEMNLFQTHTKLTLDMSVDRVKVAASIGTNSSEALALAQVNSSLLSRDQATVGHLATASAKVSKSDAAELNSHKSPSPITRQVPDAAPENVGKKNESSGQDIWYNAKPWRSLQAWHPAGVIANVKDGRAVWHDASYLDLNTMLAFTMVAYPVGALALLNILMVMVSMMLSQTDEPGEGHTNLPGTDTPRSSGGPAASAALLAGAPEVKTSKSPCLPAPAATSPDVPRDTAGASASRPTRSPFDEGYTPPIVLPESLTPRSQFIYKCWLQICCAIPAFMVFVIPMIVFGLAVPYPQEIFGAISLITAALVFGNGLYMTIYAGSAVYRLSWILRSPEDATLDRSTPTPRHAAGQRPMDNYGVTHWIILPQYMEDTGVVQQSLASISASSIAEKSISIVLAMEEREEGSTEKAEKLRHMFKDKFAEILITCHPKDLPKDPPGKASNLKWAYDRLSQDLLRRDIDKTKIILTVADADSEFHERYFTTVTDVYLEEDEERRNLRIWQSPVLHVKNYHRQPLPVVVGTMFTSMMELASTGDPNSVRFPYSTYSLSLELAQRVGGWDADWIAEDWHMGIKCFLLTVGHATTKPVWLPIINYTPEPPLVAGETPWSTWWSTIWARWAQAKRHALGFSDFSYYFMMLPLIFAFATSARSKTGKVAHLSSFWGMAVQGVVLTIRVVNVHVAMGVISVYGVFATGLRFAMQLFMSEDRQINKLFDNTFFCTAALMGASGFLMFIVSTLFMFVYNMTKDRMEKPDPNIYRFRNIWLHWLIAASSFVVFGAFYFLMLGFAVWRAAWKTLTEREFEYECAPKPQCQAAVQS